MTNKNRRDSVKSQLAKLLATENITIQTNPKAHTAYFDLKNRVLNLPLWEDISDDLYDLLLVHEVGHALDTPQEDWEAAINDLSVKLNSKASSVQTFLNVIEDVRIDKRQKRRYPGSRKNYAAGYKELLERDFLGLKGRDPASFNLIDRINIYYKGGNFLNLGFTAEEQKFVDAALETETFEEVTALTEEVYAYVKANRTERPDQEQEDGDGFSSGEGEDDGDDFSFGDLEDFLSDISDVEDSDESDDTDSEGIGSGQADEDEEGDDDTDSNSSDDGEGAGDTEHADDVTDDVGQADEDEDEEEPVSETYNNWERNQETIVAHEDTEYVYVDIPKPNLDVIVDDFDTVLAEAKSAFLSSWQMKDSKWMKAAEDGLTAFKKQENQSISFLVKEFEQRKAADEYARTATAKIGVIDTNKLFRYKYNDDIFLRHNVVREGKNHGFVMFLDWSGSMTTHLQKTIKQLITLTLFCKRVQIPFEVYSFRSLAGTDANNGFSFEQMTGPRIDFSDFRLRNLLSSRMNSNQFNEALFNLWVQGFTTLSCDPKNSTPLNEALIAASYVVDEFRARNKVQIVSTVILTDGSSDPESVVGVPYSFSKKKYYLRDRLTNQTYNISNNYSGVEYAAITETLLKVLKERTKTNLVGFYIASEKMPALVSRYGLYNKPEQELKALKTNWSNFGFFPVTNAGYDEYYILNAFSLDVRKQDLNVTDVMTKAKIAKEFISFATQKKTNRVLLKKFVDQIVK